jgi:hypothetical protein
VYLSATVVELFTIDTYSAEVYAGLQHRSETLDGCHVYWVMFLSPVRNDPGDRFAASYKDETLSGFNLGDAGGEVLICFA